VTLRLSMFAATRKATLLNVDYVRSLINFPRVQAEKAPGAAPRFVPRFSFREVSGSQDQVAARPVVSLSTPAPGGYATADFHGETQLRQWKESIRPFRARRRPKISPGRADAIRQPHAYSARRNACSCDSSRNRARAVTSRECCCGMVAVVARITRKLEDLKRAEIHHSLWKLHAIRFWLCWSSLAFSVGAFGGTYGKTGRVGGSNWNENH